MPAPTDELFRLQGVEAERDGTQVIGPIDLRIAAGRVTAIAGPSGSGKSTLLRLLNRLDAPSAGTISMMGTDIAGADPTAHRRRVGMVFQRPVALEGTVLDNLRVADPSLGETAAIASLARVGLDAELLDRDARDLSGGEAQRLGLARTLATDPAVVLFDEPTSALDPTNVSRIEELGRSLLADGTQVVWVTHSLDQLRRIADDVVVLVEGRVAQSGPVADVLSAPTPDVERYLSGEAA